MNLTFYFVIFLVSSTFATNSLSSSKFCSSLPTIVFLENFQEFQLEIGY